MFKKYKSLFFLALAGAIPCVAFAAGGEPRYHGKTLSVWVDQIDPETPMSPDQEPGYVHAIRHIGTNAIPTLIQWIKSDNAPLEDKLEAARMKALEEGKHPMMYGPGTFGSAQRAQYAFGILGSLARPAVPALQEIAMNSHDQVQYRAAIQSLIGIGEAAYPGIEAILEKGRPDVKPFAVEALEYVDDWNTNALTLIPPTVKCLLGKNGNAGDMAADVLSRSAPASSFRPMLIAALPTASPDARLRVYRCLFWTAGERGVTREETKRLLQAAVNDPDSSVRDFATNALADLASPSGGR